MHFLSLFWITIAVWIFLILVIVVCIFFHAWCLCWQKVMQFWDKGAGRPCAAYSPSICRWAQTAPVSKPCLLNSASYCFHFPRIGWEVNSKFFLYCRTSMTFSPWQLPTGAIRWPSAPVLTWMLFLGPHPACSTIGFLSSSSVLLPPADSQPPCFIQLFLFHDFAQQSSSQVLFPPLYMKILIFCVAQSWGYPGKTSSCSSLQVPSSSSWKLQLQEKVWLEFGKIISKWNSLL